jgi:hypothetical protein
MVQRYFEGERRVGDFVQAVFGVRVNDAVDEKPLHLVLGHPLLDRGRQEVLACREQRDFASTAR